MGNLPLCGDMCTPKPSKTRSAPRAPRSPGCTDQVIAELIGTLAKLYDVNGDGYISIKEMCDINEKKASLHKERFTKEDAEQVRQDTVDAFKEELDADLRPVTLAMYKDYMQQWLQATEPRDLNARLYLMEGIVIEAQLGRKELERLEREQTLPRILDSLTAQEFVYNSPCRKFSGQKFAM
ncbi:unnamed protein product [Effrenium voratum]|nr:unnamed protein product [Effrenium voratum]